MKTMKMLKWNWLNTYVSMIIIAAVVLIICTAFALLVNVLNDRTGTVSLHSSFTIWLFVMGIVIYHMGLRTGLSMGVSRRSFFLALVLYGLSVSAAMALIDVLFMALFHRFFDVLSGSELSTFVVRVLQDGEMPLTPLTLSFSLAGQYLVRYLCGGTMFVAVGVFIASGYYRMGKLAKVLASIGVPAAVILFAALLAAGVLPAALTAALIDLMVWVAASWVNSALMSLACAALLLGATWLITRRAAIRTATM